MACARCSRGWKTVEGQFDCITARAFASLADMLGWGGHLLAPDGIWLAMKGKRPDDELAGMPPGFAVRGTRMNCTCRGCRPNGICW